eukprot:7350784-Pyramimonas_sp.AAC.1
MMRLCRRVLATCESGKGKHGDAWGKVGTPCHISVQRTQWSGTASATLIEPVIVATQSKQNHSSLTSTYMAQWPDYKLSRTEGG